MIKTQPDLTKRITTFFLLVDMRNLKMKNCYNPDSIS